MTITESTDFVVEMAYRKMANIVKNPYSTRNKGFDESGEAGI